MLSRSRAVALGVTVTLAAALVAACGTSHREATAPDLGAITALLQRHASAVLSRSRSAFVTDLDGSAAAADFRTRQAAEFDNLAPVPLASWAYQVDDLVRDRAPTASATHRLGAPAVIAHVILQYRIAGVDAQPSQHDEWWTFVQRRGRVYLAGDSDLEQDGSTGWRGPWDFGPLVVRRGTTSVVIAHPSQAGAVAGLGQAADAAVTVVRSVVADGWSGHVAVIVPATEAELAQQAQGAQPTPLQQVSAETVFDPIGTNGPPGGPRVVVNPDVLGRLTGVGRRIVLQHEITHVAMAAATTASTPKWVAEGFAEYVGEIGSGQPVPVAAQELAAAVRRGAVPTALPGDDAFAGSTAAQAYQQAWLACRYLASRAGVQALVRFVRLVGASSDGPAGAVAAALQTMLHESVVRFVAQWRGYLMAQLR